MKEQLTRPALPYDFTIYMLCRRYSICMYNYRVYNNLFWIFYKEMEYRLQSMYNHMVGRATSVISPFYFMLLDSPLCKPMSGQICFFCFPLKVNSSFVLQIEENKSRKEISFQDWTRWYPPRGYSDKGLRVTLNIFLFIKYFLVFLQLFAYP